jgi:RecB family endonuclease NucS
MSIIINRGGSETVRLEPRGIPRETFLQEYVRDHPEVLPLDEIREGTRLCVVAREVSTGSGPIDVLALDGDGAVYVIETKLYKNPDKRTVVAQALDYGAALWRQYTIGSDFTNDLRDAVRRLGGDEPLEEQLAEQLDIDGQAASTFST